MKSKKCCTCQETKPFSEFHKNASRKDGYHDQCKSCRAIERGRVPRNNLPEKKATKKTVVVVSAEVGQKPVKSYMNSLLNFCKRNKAELFVLGMRGQMKALESQLGFYDASLAPYLCRKVQINENLFAEDLEINPQVRNPLQGLQKFGNEEHRQSVIVAHSKQHMVTLGSLGHPRVHYSTGCITPSNYLKDTRVGRIAELEHFHGGIIVDIIDDKLFLPQDFEFGEDGGFTNFGTRYLPSGKIKKDKCLFNVNGDWHLDTYEFFEEFLESSNARILVEQQKFYSANPFWWNNSPAIICHDLASWTQTSHFNQNDARASDKHSYSERLDMLDECLGWLAGICNDLYIVQSNHDDHLGNYLKKGDFKDAGESIQTICSHAADYFCSGDVFSYIGAWHKYLLPKSNFKIAGCTLSLHGHLATAGKRGSLAAIEQDVPNCVIGHSHAPGIRNKAKQVGYNGNGEAYADRCPSNWLQANCHGFASGMKQLVISVNGQWLPERLKKKEK